MNKATLVGKGTSLAAPLEYKDLHRATDMFATAIMAFDELIQHSWDSHRYMWEKPAKITKQSQKQLHF